MCFLPSSIVSIDLLDSVTQSWRVVLVVLCTLVPAHAAEEERFSGDTKW
jgi:hypothetical protein